MLNASQQATFDHLFSIIEKTGDGNIEEKDFVLAFLEVKRAAGKDRADEADQAVRRWYLSLKVFADTDKDKFISKAEWNAWAEGLAAELAETGEVGRKYKHFTDAVWATMALGETSVTEKDYAVWFNGLGLGGNANVLFTKMDNSRNGSLSRDEFYAHLISLLKGEENAVEVFGHPITTAEFIEAKINHYAQSILTYKDTSDAIAVGEIKTYALFRSILQGTATTYELGAFDAISDFLAFKGIAPKGKSIVKDEIAVGAATVDAEATLKFLEDKINRYAGLIIGRNERSDAAAIGQLEIYTVLRRAATKSTTADDLGVYDAIGDFLVFRGILKKGTSLVH
jgi:hypothetical protein